MGIKAVLAGETRAGGGGCVCSARAADDVAEKQVNRFPQQGVALCNDPHLNCEPRFLLNCTSSRNSGLLLLRILPTCRLPIICIPAGALPETYSKHYLKSGVQLESALPATEVLHNALFATLQLLMTYASNALRSNPLQYASSKSVSPLSGTCDVNRLTTG